MPVDLENKVTRMAGVGVAILVAVVAFGPWMLLEIAKCCQPHGSWGSGSRFS